MDSLVNQPLTSDVSDGQRGEIPALPSCRFPIQPFTFQALEKEKKKKTGSSRHELQGIPSPDGVVLLPTTPRLP